MVVPAERLLNGEKIRSKEICLLRFSLRIGETRTKTMLIIVSGMRSTIPQKSSTWRISKFLSLVWRIGAGFYSTYAVTWRVILGLARNLSTCDSSQVVTICLSIIMTKLKFKDHSLMLSSNERTQLGGQSLGKSLPSRWSFKKDTRGSTIPKLKHCMNAEKSQLGRFREHNTSSTI